MKSYLNFKSRVAVLLENCKIFVTNKGNLLIRSFGAKHITKRDVFKSFCLSNIIIIGTSSPVSQGISSFS